MATKTDELLKEFAHRWGWKFTPKNEGDEWECHPKEIISDLRTLMDKLMPTMTDDEIKAEICKDDPVMDSDNEWLYGYRYGRLIGAKWFRNRMKV